MSATQLVVVVFGALVFAAIGSFTCVIIDRLPVELSEPNQYGDLYDSRPWREVFGGNSRCSSCGEPVRPWDNVPILSWILLRGRCRGCGDRIPVFHPIVELASPALFLLGIWAFGLDDWRLLPLLWLIPVGLAISVIDFRTYIVPTRLVWPAFFVSIALAVASALLEGEPRWLLTALVGLGALAGPLFIIWFIHPRGMGFGDVRLAVLLGWNIGFFSGVNLAGGLINTLIALTVAAIVGLVAGVVVLGVRGRKAAVPFGPFLILGTLFCILLAEQILDPFGVYTLT